MTHKTVLLTTTEVADYLGISRSTISNRVTQNNMPEPDAYTFKGRPLWKTTTVDCLKNQIIPRNTQK